MWSLLLDLEYHLFPSDQQEVAHLLDRWASQQVIADW
jgi:hypothetical protein